LQNQQTNSQFPINVAIFGYLNETDKLFSFPLTLVSVTCKKCFSSNAFPRMLLLVKTLRYVKTNKNWRISF